MVVGRLFHYAADLILISTVLAGVKRNSGFQLSTETIPEGPFKTTADTVLNIGERVFDYTSALSYTSGWFERESKK